MQKQISASWIRFTENTIDFVRTAVEMDNVLVDIERSVKQFKVLESSSIESLATNGLVNYLGLIEEICLTAQGRVESLCNGQSNDARLLMRQYRTLDNASIESILGQLKARQTSLMDGLWQNVNDEKNKQIEFGENLLDRKSVV